MQPAERVGSLPPYFFASLLNEVESLKGRGLDVIRLDIGSPDLPPPAPVVEAMVKALQRPDTHGYAPHGGTPAFREAAAAYYRARFGVELDPSGEVLGLLGSKEGVFNMALAWLNPGDVALVPDPGYPVYSFGARMAGAEVVTMPLRPGNAYLPDLSAIPAEVLRRARLMWLNYPNNPTAAVTSPEALADVVAFARRHEILVCHDAPYMDVCFDGYTAPSILQVPGARDVAVEFNSLSKSFNMAGWRLGIAVGHTAAVKALGNLKTNIDSGHFIPAMEAGAVALRTDHRWISERNRVYQERRDILVEGMRRADFEAELPQASLYVWAAIPGGRKSTEFCASLLRETGVSLTPGSTFGAQGEGFVRASLGLATPKVREAAERLVEWARRA